MRSSPRATLAACTTAYFAVRVGQVVVSPVLPEVTRAFDTSAAAVGAALTLMWAAYALTQLPSGLLAVRVGERRTVLLALLVATVGSLAVAAAPTYDAFALAIALLGAGAGLYYNAAAVRLSTEFKAVSTALGVHKLGSRAAGVVAPVLATWALLQAGWRAAPTAAAGVAVVGFLLAAALIRPTSPAADGGFALRAAVGTLRSRRVAGTTGLTAAGEFVEQAAVTFLPTALVTLHGLSVPAAGALFSVHFAASAAAGPAMGWLGDRLSPGAAALVTSIAGVVGFGLLAASTGVALPVAVALTGVATGWTAPLQARVLESLPSESEGGGFGAFRTAYLLVGSLGSAVVGTVADAAGWTVALAFLAGVLGVVAAVLAGELLARGSV